MIFTIMGYKVENVEQARSILFVAVLKGDKTISEQCRSVITQYEKSY